MSVWSVIYFNKHKSLSGPPGWMGVVLKCPWKIGFEGGNFIEFTEDHVWLWTLVLAGLNFGSVYSMSVLRVSWLFIWLVHSTSR